MLALIASDAYAQDKTVKIGVLTDNSGLFSDLGGAGSTVAAQMAVEDSGLAAKGWKIDVISADHQNKPDVSPPILGVNGSMSRRSTSSRMFSAPAWRSRSAILPNKRT